MAGGNHTAAPPSTTSVTSPTPPVSAVWRQQEGKIRGQERLIIQIPQRSNKHCKKERKRKYCELRWCSQRLLVAFKVALPAEHWRIGTTIARNTCTENSTCSRRSAINSAHSMSAPAQRDFNFSFALPVPYFLPSMICQNNRLHMFVKRVFDVLPQNMYFMACFRLRGQTLQYLEFTCFSNQSLDARAFAVFFPSRITKLPPNAGKTHFFCCSSPTPANDLLLMPQENPAL